MIKSTKRGHEGIMGKSSPYPKNITHIKKHHCHHSGPQELLSKAEKWGLDVTSVDFAKLMDKMDSLSHLRNEFHYPKCGELPKVDSCLVDVKGDCVYFCGNSLGLQPKKTASYIQRELNKWSQIGVYGHFLGELPWALGDEKLSAAVANLVGAQDDEVAQMNGLTVNQHLLLISFYQPTNKRKKVLLESKAFPSDHYTIESQIKLRGYDPKECMICMEPRKGEETLRTEDILALIEEQGDEIATIMFPGVQYYTGQLFDMEAITKAGHKKGCYVGFDLAHAFGNVELKLHHWDVDFACWCSYKYGNSGAGGLGGAFINSRFKKQHLPKLDGWWSHKMETRFMMNNQLDLAEGAAGYRISNPSMLLVAALQASLDVFSMTTMTDLCNKSRLLTGYLELLLKVYYSKPEDEADNSRPYVTILTPSNPRERGCQLSVMFSLPIAAVFEAIEKRGIVCDKREPNVLRIAPAPLYNSFEDVHRFITILGEAFADLSK